MNLSITAPPEWVEQASCASADPEVWFPRVGEVATVREAKRICRTCPVRQQCLELAIENHEQAGVWGGLTVNERRAYSNGSAKFHDANSEPEQPDTRACGTIQGYRRHCRARTVACDPCLAAHREYQRGRKLASARESREQRAARDRAARSAMVTTIAELASQGVPIAEAVERAGASSLAAARAAATRSGHGALARAIGGAEWAAKRAAGAPGRKAAPCGTRAAYTRHRRNGETPDQACIDANAEYMRRQREAGAHR